MASHDGQQPQSDLLRSRKVCATGRLISMPRADFQRLVAEHGGTLQSFPTRGTRFLVIGQDGWPTERDGEPTRAFERARKLRAYGYPIELLSEEPFFERLGLSQQVSPVRGRHTVHDLKRLLDVSGAQVRRWVRLGLIEPVETAHRLWYFDFHQVAAARKLCELVQSGVALGRIRQGLESLEQWLPADALPLAQLAMLEQDGKLLARLDGRLIEPSGQQRFDFESAASEPVEDAAAVAMVAPLEDVDELFDRALVLEDAGRFDEAADLYRRALASEPHDPVLHFNLGNVFYSQGDADGAAESFRRALDCDPNYAEAWNNLGNVLADRRQHSEAVDAFRQALLLVSDYEDARINLETILGEISPPPHLRVIS